MRRSDKKIVCGLSCGLNRLSTAELERLLEALKG
jgi:hypothetical protein